MAKPQNPAPARILRARGRPELLREPEVQVLDLAFDEAGVRVSGGTVHAAEAVGMSVSSVRVHIKRAVARVERAESSRPGVTALLRQDAETLLTDAVDVAGLAAGEDLAYGLEAAGLADVRTSDWPVFRLLQASGPLPVNALAQKLGITQQATSKAVRLMEYRGYTALADSPSDGRVREVCLTPEAFHVIDLGARWAAEHHAHAVDRWGEIRVRQAVTLLTEFAAGCSRSGAKGRDLMSGR